MTCTIYIFYTLYFKDSFRIKHLSYQEVDIKSSNSVFILFILESDFFFLRAFSIILVISETAHKYIIDCVQSQFITVFGCFIALLKFSFALALRKRMNYLMASCTNKTFTVIYMWQNPGEIKSSNSIWSWNFAELNRNCTIATNIEIKPSEDVL